MKNDAPTRAKMKTPLPKSMNSPPSPTTVGDIVGDIVGGGVSDVVSDVVSDIV